MGPHVAICAGVKSRWSSATPPSAPSAPNSPNSTSSFQSWHMRASQPRTSSMRDPLSHHGGGVCGINDMLGIGGDHRRRGTFHTRALGTDQDASLVSSLPFIGLLSTTLALGLVKLTAYSQLEVVRTAMLSRHVKNGGAKVLQLGGTTRDLYYYPAKTLSVTVNVSDGGTRTRGLFEQAGMTVGIPTTATTVSLDDCLASTPSASLDSVVAFEQFGGVDSTKVLQSIAKEVSRVLKPGGTFIFYERIAREGGLAQLGAKQGSRLDVGDVIAGLDVWDFCEYDTAAGGLDRHDVGVAIKGMREAEMGGSVDSSAFEALVRKNRNKANKEGGKANDTVHRKRQSEGGRGF